MYLHLILCSHTSDMADYHCAHVLTSGIVFTYIWFGGLSLCPCTYIWYCIVHALDNLVCNFSCRFASCNYNRHSLVLLVSKSHVILEWFMWL